MRSEKTFLSICAAAFALSCTSPLFAAEPSDPPPPPPQPSEASPGGILPPPPPPRAILPEEGPEVPAPPSARPGRDAQLSPETRAKIREMQKEIEAIRKADIEKRRSEMLELRQQIERYREEKSDDAKEKLMQTLSKRFDSRIAAREKRIADQKQKLEQEKADKAKIIAEEFERMVNAPERGKQHMHRRDKAPGNPPDKALAPGRNHHPGKRNANLPGGPRKRAGKPEGDTDVTHMPPSPPPAVSDPQALPPDAEAED